MMVRAHGDTTLRRKRSKPPGRLRGNTCGRVDWRKMEGRYELVGVQATVNDFLGHVSLSAVFEDCSGVSVRIRPTKQYFTANSWEMLLRIDNLSLRLFFRRTFVCLASLLDAYRESWSCRLQMGRSDVGRGGRDYNFMDRK